MCLVIRRSCRLVLAALFAATPAIATEVCGVTDNVLDDGFEPALILPGYTQPGPDTPLTLAVADPPDNTVTGFDRIVLQGSFTGPPNTGIVAGGRLAAHSDTRFVAPPIALEPGANAITVQLHTVDGPGPSVVHHLTYDPALAPRARLLPATVSAMAPTAIAFDVALKPGEPLALTRLRLDTDGNGSIDLDTTQPDTAKAGYPQPGLVKITGTATLDDADPNTPAVQVPLATWFLAQHPQQTRYALCSAFGTLRTRLAAGTIPAALKTLNPALQDRFEPFWTSIAPQLPSIAGTLGTIIDGRFSSTEAELLLARPIEGQPGQSNAFRMQWSVGTDGVWRIDAM
ncbi:hypothetical protein [Chiayiivirga flava]|uniref:Uncharacterized protein n=1 Tax=Chiayiivirga flava TaxID=659595 RepID=A0A7W8G1W9_9GAMM|nr:hypothetical protein [Chiayiivirga flava]MBB5209333.1 hypothetical protein [Chiayiivirga flava]